MAVVVLAATTVILASPSGAAGGDGYTLIDDDGGGSFAYGDANGLATPHTNSVIAGAMTPAGTGGWLVDKKGAVTALDQAGAPPSR